MTSPTGETDDDNNDSLQRQGREERWDEEDTGSWRKMATDHTNMSTASARGTRQNCNSIIEHIQFKNRLPET